MNKLFRKSVSWLCLLAMIISILPTSIFAAAGPQETVNSGINGYQATMQADEVTSEGYKTAFGNKSAAYDGKIWADKSVNVSETDKEAFDVTLSALGQTFASKTTTKTEVAFDVVFVVDVSPSMNYGMDSNSEETVSLNQTRMMATVNALNSATTELMKNTNNRMAVVAFGGSASNMVELNHYNNAKFDYSRRIDYYTSGTLSFSSSDINRPKTQSIISSTNPQRGLFNARNILTNASIESDGLTRIPVVILLTDGQPTDSSANYITGQNSDNTSDKADNVSAEDYYYTICTAATINDQIENAYKDKQQNSANKDKISTGFYTIGLALEDGSNEAIMLDPKKRSDDTDRSLSGTINNNSAEKMGFSTYDYADKSYIGQMSQDELEKIFNEIIGSITSISGVEKPGESTGDRDKITFVDTLGEGVTLAPQMSLNVPTIIRTSNVEMKVGDPKNYTLVVYAGDEQLTSVEEIEDHLKNSGDVITYKVNNATGTDEYDTAAVSELSVKATMTTSGRIQIDYAIPSALMAYNVRITTDSGTEYFDELGPIQLTYTAKLRSDVNTAGSYLIGAPAQTYMQFMPSSVKNDDGNYKMPYYWTDLGRNEGEKAKDGTGVGGASNYITNTTVTDNNTVQVYLGNNGLYTLTGKALTLNLTWDDANNQDGKRPDEVKVQLFKEKVSGDSTDIPDEPANSTIVGEPISLNQANLTEDGGTNLWRHATSELPTYEDNQFLRYWVKITTPLDDTDYSADLTNDGQGHHAQNSEWYCFSVGEVLLAHADLDITLSHQPEMMKYTVEKKWHISGDKPNSIKVQLYANGQQVHLNDSKELVEGATPFEITANENWKTSFELPKYYNGQPAIYNFVEVSNNGQYSAITNYDDAANGNIVIDNYDAVDKTSLTTVKQWEDNKNQDGIQPTSVEIKLTADGMTDAELQSLLGDQSITQTLTADKNWEYTWKDLPKSNDNGNITYSVSETNVPGYTSSVAPSPYNANTIFITNSYTPATINVTINKTWNDNNDQDGLRPANVSGILYKKVGDENKLTAVRSYIINGDTPATINNLPAKENGKDITYYVTENTVNNYTLTVDGQEATDIGGIKAYKVENGSISLTNTHKVATTSYTATFTWDDNDNRDGQRPNSFKVTLTGGDVKSELTVTVDENGTIKNVTGLPSGAKVETNGSIFTITGLPASKGGSAISYTMNNVNIDNGYTSSITGVGSNSMDFTLSYSTQAITLGFTKEWAGDSENTDMRPSANGYANYLTLKADGATKYLRPNVNDNGDGTYTVTYSGLDKYDNNNKEITYTVTERAVPNYTTEDAEATLTADNSDKITNTYAREVYDKIEVTKVWNDADGQSLRPDIITAKTENNGKIDIRLYNREDSDENQGKWPDDIIDNNNNTWTYVWNNVPKIDQSGREIDYTAFEVKVPEGYVGDDVVIDENVEIKDISSDRYADILNGNARGEITNTLDTSAAATGKLNIEKVWDDKGYSDKRGTVVLDVRGKVEGSDSSSTTQRITLEKQADGSIKATEGNNITYQPSNTENSWGTVSLALPITQNGKTITYYVDEITVPTGYTASYDGASANNRVELSADEAKNITVTNTYKPTASDMQYATVEVVWDDNGNACGIRPTSVPFTLKGEKYDVDLADAAGVRISTNDGKTKWIYTVPTKFDRNETFAQSDLTVDALTRKHNDDKEGTYKPAVAVNGNTYTITMTHEMETVDYSVSKTWNAGGSGINVEKAEVDVQLLANGEALKDSTVTLTGDDSHKWEKLPRYEGGQAIVYHAVETADMSATDPAENDPTGVFNAEYNWNNPKETTIKNIYSKTRNITLLCNWDDEHNAYGERPENITVQLCDENGNPITVDASGAPITDRVISGNQNDTWDTVWNNLPIADANGKTIEYKVRIVSDIGDEYDTSEPTYYGFNDNVAVINNTLKEETASISTTKTWNDAENQYKTRPESVYVNLLQDGLVYQTAELNEGNSWASEWKDLPSKDHDYTVEEQPVAGYTASYEGGTITNTLDSLEELQKEYKVTFVYEHASATDKDGKPIAANTAFTVPSSSDYSFTAAADSGYTLTSRPIVSGAVKLVADKDDSWTLENIKSDVTVTIKATKKEDPRPPIIINPGDKDDEDDNKDPEKPDDLNTDDHFSYIVGYPIDYRTGLATDNEDLWPVQPEGKITRAEVATIFYRLLKDDVRDKYETARNGFSDVDKDDWFNTTVSTLSNMEIVRGYDDGSFRPNAPITRAEFAAIATRFFEKTGATYEPGTFTDVSGNEWYAGAIQDAVDLGLIGGYPDNTVRPNNNITRAEACAIVNRTLGRAPSADHLLPADEMKTWPDSPKNAWYYADVQEATNGHEYKWITDDKTKVEKWTKLLNKNWNDRQG